MRGDFNKSPLTYFTDYQRINIAEREIFWCIKICI